MVLKTRDCLTQNAVLVRTAIITIKFRIKFSEAWTATVFETNYSVNY